MLPSADDDGQPGTLRLADIYAELIRTSERVKILSEVLPDHESRLRSLERWRYSLPVALGGSGGAGLLALLAYFHRQ